MRALLLASFLATAAAGFARADGLADALAARSLLGPDVWARVVRIENTASGGAGRRSGYPATTYALVFELSGILWFYSDVDGTQSLSQRLGSTDADKLNPGPLLRAICSGFASWEWADGAPPRDGRLREQAPNDCFIECLAILRRRISRGGELGNPRLLLCYAGGSPGRAGHAVLLFESGGGLTAVDPDDPDRDIRIPAYVAADLRSVAGYVRRGAVAGARALGIAPFAKTRPGARWAALPPAGPSAG